MAERGIGVDKVESIIQGGTIISRYDYDTPFPSCLALGFDAGQPWHVVYSIEETEHDTVTHVITVYRPDPLEWDGRFTKRKTQE